MVPTNRFNGELSPTTGNDCRCDLCGGGVPVATGDAMSWLTRLGKFISQRRQSYPAVMWDRYARHAAIRPQGLPGDEWGIGRHFGH
jgi:hypothetical protein